MMTCPAGSVNGETPRPPPSSDLNRPSRPLSGQRRARAQMAFRSFYCCFPFVPSCLPACFSLRSLHAPCGGPRCVCFGARSKAANLLRPSRLVRSLTEQRDFTFAPPEVTANCCCCGALLARGFLGLLSARSVQKMAKEALAVHQDDVVGEFGDAVVLR